MNTKNDAIKSFSEDSTPESLNEDYIHRYIHMIHTYANTNTNTNTKRIHTTTSFYPDIWQEFRSTVRYNEPYDVHPNHVLEAFMLWYINAHKTDLQQPKLTVFINKPEQVNIAEKQVVVQEKKRTDYSKLSLEQLQTLYDFSTTNYGERQLIAYELKKRGVK